MMDNQMFPGGSFVVDDGPQGCSLCGLLFNNSISLQHHMQFHILSANPQLLPVNQGPDLGLGLNAAAAANLMDMIACASSSGSSSNLVPGQPMFTSVPSHLLTANLGLVSNPLQPLPLSQPVPKVKEKKGKSTNKSAVTHTTIDTIPTSSHPSRSASTATTRVSQSSSSSFLSSFPKDLSKSDTPMVTKPVSTVSGKTDRDRQIFPQSMAPFDQIEDALALPTYSKASSFERQISGSLSSTAQSSQGKESTTKLFQPFPTDDSLGYNIPKSSAIYSADHLLSPVKSTISDKPIDLDILTTPQKVSYHGSNESLSSSPKATVSSDFSRKSASKVPVTSVAETLPMKSLFYSGLMDPLNVSPKASSTQPFRDGPDLATLPGHFGGSRSSSPQTSTNNDLFVSQAPVVTPAMLSPKISLGVPPAGTDTTPGKLFTNNADDAPAGSAASSSNVQPPVFMNSTAIINQPPIAVPDIAQISNGTGYFNALTQKLINPGLSLSTDFAKLNPASSSSFGTDAQKAKSYFENGILISHDYDKISDTNDEDDLDRLIDGIDTKETQMDKGYSEIEDLLNEFNENHPEDISKQKSQMDDFLLNDVLTDTSRLKSDIRTDTTITDDLINCNSSAISELIEKENEVIDKESKMLESARLKSLTEVSKTSEPNSPESVTPSTSTSVVTNPVVEPPVAVSEQKPPERKDDDPTDFEIPKVGKLMKIRKYFESQEQKKKQEQTESEKEAEIKIKEKGPVVVEEKPLGTILVQVSKRKKIEYGPYINRQSLLEGKPSGKEADSPPKVFRPKPKPPQVPVRSNFNLRARKTRTDFASLASRGSKTPDVKKGEEKEKVKIVEKAKSDDKVLSGDDKSGDDKIRTRNKDRREKEKTDKEPVSKENDSSETVKVQVEPVEKKEGRPNLRTRAADKASKSDNVEGDIKTRASDKSIKTDNVEVEGKSLRRRTVKTSPEGLKIKITKQDQCSKSDLELSTDEKSRKKVLRNAQKTVTDKPDIKKCSVNLGENLSEYKLKTVMRTSCVKEKDSSETCKDDINVENEKERDDNEVVNSFPEEVQSTDGIPTSKGKKLRGKLGAKLREKQSASLEQSDLQPDVRTDDTDNKKVEENLMDGENNKSSEKINDISEKDESVNTVQIEEENVEVVNEKEVLVPTESSEEQVSNISIVEPIEKVEKVEKVSIKIKLGGEFQKKYQKGLNNARKRKLGLKSSRRESRHDKKAKVVEIKPEENKEIVDIPEKEMVDSEIVEEKEPEEKCIVESQIDMEMKDEEVKYEEVKYEEVKDEEVKYEEMKDEEVKDEDTKDKEVKEDLPEILPVESEVEFCLTEPVIEEVKEDVSETPEECQVQTCSTSTHAELTEHDPDSKAEMEEKKVKHSVENEFQRLVDEAMAAVKNETDDTGKTSRYSNLRKRLNESIRYNVDDSDDEPELPLKMAYYPPVSALAKGLNKYPLKPEKKGFQKLLQRTFVPSAKPQVKKDVDVYDFTDTEMSDKEEEMPSKLSFKPKYVTNIKSFGQTQLPFVSKSMSSSPAPVTEDLEEVKNADANEESAYVGKTVEPLKIKLTKIIPYVEKKHKHKKKKKKKDKKRRNSRDESFETIDSADERESAKSCDTETVASNDVDDPDKSAETLEDDNSNECNDEESDSPQGRGMKKIKTKERKTLEKKHMCFFCNQGFSQKCDLRKHIMIHTGERPFPCNICEKRFLRKTDLVKHTRTHTGEKPYACEFCDKRVSDKSQLNVHRRLHTGDRPYQCTKCGKGCITSSELTRHRAVHCSDNIHVCELCKKTFKIKECLGMHMKMHYRSRTRAVKCSKCSFGFDRTTDLERHKCSALATNVYICGECSEEFSDEMLYGEHIQTHDLDVFSCNMCTHIFDDKASLETHLCNLGVDKQPKRTILVKEEHSPEDGQPTAQDDDVGSFMCDLCSEMFTVRKHFLVHLKSHETSKAAHGIIRPSSNSSSSSEATPPSRNAFDQFKMNSNNVLKEASLRENLFSSQENMTGLNAGTRNATRASVILGGFRNVDGSGLKDAGKVKGSKLDATRNKVDPLGPLCQSGSVFEQTATGIVGNRRHSKIPESEKLFDTTEFSNSPDFSSLTDEGSLSFDLYQKYSPGTRDTTSQTRNFNRLSAMSPPAATVAAEAAEKKDFGPSSNNVTSPMMNPPQGGAQSQADYRWPYHVQPPDYNLLNKAGLDDSGSNPDFSVKPPYGGKVEGRENVFPKAEALLTSAASRPTSEGFKDNIENHAKSNIFLDFDCPLTSQKADGYQQSNKNIQQKFGSPNSNESTAFQGLNQNSYNLSRNRQQYQNEKSDFANYSSFLNTFHSNSLFTNSNSANLFGPASDKRSSNSSMFAESSDPIHNNYFLTVEESLKGTSPSDKTDETAALLSNFDYSMS